MRNKYQGRCIQQNEMTISCILRSLGQEIHTSGHNFFLLEKKSDKAERAPACLRLTRARVRETADRERSVTLEVRPIARLGLSRETRSEGHSRARVGSSLAGYLVQCTS